MIEKCMQFCKNKTFNVELLWLIQTITKPYFFINTYQILNNWILNFSEVKIKYEFSKPFRSKRFSKDENHAQSEEYLWPFNYIQSNYKTIIQ